MATDKRYPCPHCKTPLPWELKSCTNCGGRLTTEMNLGTLSDIGAGKPGRWHYSKPLVCAVCGIEPRKIVIGRQGLTHIYCRKHGRKHAPWAYK